MAPKAAAVLVACTIGLLLLVSRLAGGNNDAQLAELREANDRLRAKLRSARQHVADLRTEKQSLEASVASAARVDTASASASAATASGPTAADAAGGELLALHSHWDWPSLVHDMLQPFGAISEQQIESAVARCADNATMYCARVQIHDNQLYITDYRGAPRDRAAAAPPSSPPALEPRPRTQRAALPSQPSSSTGTTRLRA